MKCPFCTCGYIKFKVTTDVYRCGYYDAVRKCKNCNGTGQATAPSTDCRSLAAGK